VRPWEDESCGSSSASIAVKASAEVLREVLRKSFVH
jgi:hypothetical protein